MNTKKLKQLFEDGPNKYATAKGMGTSYQTLYKIINGADFKVSTLESIAKFYNVPVGYFFDEVEADGSSLRNKEIADYLKGQIKVLKDSLIMLGMKREDVDNL